MVGVGGQGTILASKILTMGLLEAGYDVKMSEIHGMSQRGGSVCSQVRYGDSVASPVIDKGGADMLIAFEKMEALRNLDFLKKDGTVVVNDHEIMSIPVITGDETYASDILDEINKHVDAKVINAASLAEELGNAKVANIILLGTIIKIMNLESIHWEDIVRAAVKPRFVDINLKALEVGMKAVQ
jgi:indolepyruvate ferredoxin oxidoreductase beta subunit